MSWRTSDPNIEKPPTPNHGTYSGFGDIGKIPGPQPSYDLYKFMEQLDGPVKVEKK